MSSIEDSIGKANALGNTVWVGGCASREAIDALEKAAGFNLPASYKKFLHTWGALSIGDDHICGIVDDDPLSAGDRSFFGATQAMRKTLGEEYAVPDYLWVVNRHEDGAFCFNTQLTTGSDELAIVNYEPYAREESFSEVLAQSFDEFLNLWYFTAYVDDSDD